MAVADWARKEVIPKVSIFTDGSSKSRGDCGGWAAILKFYIGQKEIIKEISGHMDGATTNQVAELTAVVMGLEALKQSCAVELVSDSEYVVKGINYWLQLWASKNWRTSTHKPVANLELWQKIYELKKLHRVTARHVRGHNSCQENNRCDVLANQARLSVV